MNIRDIYFAGGCFWGTEKYFKLIKGVVGTEEYHQNYLDKNPDGYCHLSQELFEYAKNSNREEQHMPSEKIQRTPAWLDDPK